MPTASSDTGLPGCPGPPSYGRPWIPCWPETASLCSILSVLTRLELRLTKRRAVDLCRVAGCCCCRSC
ncbi:MAG: Ms5788A family Cys-rich leader peptide [Mycobacterium sp.]